MIILHITTQEAWSAVLQAGEYRPPSLDEEGFIHASYPEQLLRVANDLFLGERNLLLLIISIPAVAAIIRHDYVPELAQLHPHLYGPLPVAAVLEVVAFPPGEDGRFTFPPSLERYL